MVLPADSKEITMGDSSPLSAVSLHSTADPLRLSHPLQPVDPIEEQMANPEANKENSISCKVCGKVYLTEAKLKNHVYNTHKRARNFKCDWPTCAKAFQGKRLLEEHKLTHTGLKPHKCTEQGCGKSFALKGHLNTHMVMHTGQKLYECTNCGKSFGHKWTLKSHMVVHTRQKPYECSECGRSFGRKDTLNRHKLSHSSEKLQDEVDVVEQELVHEEVPVGEEPVHEEVLVKCKEVVKEEMECKAQCEEMEEESDPLS